jgi:hypothetical protein
VATGSGLGNHAGPPLSSGQARLRQREHRRYGGAAVFQKSTEQHRDENPRANLLKFGTKFLKFRCGTRRQETI